MPSFALPTDADSAETRDVTSDVDESGGGGSCRSSPLPIAANGATPETTLLRHVSLASDDAITLAGYGCPSSSVIVTARRTR